MLARSKLWSWEWVVEWGKREKILEYKMQKYWIQCLYKTGITKEDSWDCMCIIKGENANIQLPGKQIECFFFKLTISILLFIMILIINTIIYLG